MKRRYSRSVLPDLLRHLEAEAASLVHLRADQPPVFWKGNERLADSGRFAVLRRDDLRRLVCIPLTEDQLREYQQRNFLAMPLRIAQLGAFHFEAYARKGCEEVVIASAARSDPWTLFRDHHDLLAEARLAPEDADVYWNLGMAFIDEGEHHLAWHAFDKARELAPDDATIHFQIGKLLGHHLYRVDEAIAALERATALPTPDVHVELAVMLRSSQRLRDAEAAVRRGLAAHPDHAFLLEALGVILLELDRASDAIVVLEHSLQVHGPNPEIHELLAQARSYGAGSAGRNSNG